MNAGSSEVELGRGPGATIEPREGEIAALAALHGGAAGAGRLAPGQARQPFSCTSRTISAISVGVRLLASGTRHAPAARSPRPPAHTRCRSGPGGRSADRPPRPGPSGMPRPAEIRVRAARSSASGSSARRSARAATRSARPTRRAGRPGSSRLRVARRRAGRLPRRWPGEVPITRAEPRGFVGGAQCSVRRRRGCRGREPEDSGAECHQELPSGRNSYVAPWRPSCHSSMGQLARAIPSENFRPDGTSSRVSW